MFDPADVVVAVGTARMSSRCRGRDRRCPALVDARIRAGNHRSTSAIRSYDVETRFVVSDRRGAGLRGRLVTKGYWRRRGAAPTPGSRWAWFVGGTVEPISDDGPAPAVGGALRGLGAPAAALLKGARGGSEGGFGIGSRRRPSRACAPRETDAGLRGRVLRRQPAVA